MLKTATKLSLVISCAAIRPAPIIIRMRGKTFLLLSNSTVFFIFHTPEN